jgi:pimeloyl-ACP methyl ester carboxylesterase
MTLPYDELGDGPTVLLLHAGVADRSMWSEHLQPLAGAGYRAIAIDLPGFGEAQPDGLGAPWDEAIATLDALALDRAALVGNSFGGIVAQNVAVVAPERVLALALVSSPAPDLEPSPDLQAAWEAEEEALERDDLDGAVEAVVAAWTLPGSPPALRERVGAMQRRAFELQLAAPDAPEPQEPLRSLAQLSGVRAPALVAAGEHEMPDFLLAAQSLARALPSARSTVIEGAGHLAPLEQPLAFRELLLDFLAAAS